MKCKHNAIALTQENTKIPVPTVDAIEPRRDCDVKAPFILMDCLPGNVGMDLGMTVPPKFRKLIFQRASTHPCKSPIGF
jgi:hypothetical protein